MDTELTPEIRKEVIEATELCKNPKCTAHDAVVMRIWEYAHKADPKNAEIKEAIASEILGRLKYL
jgi:hypothetical protein